MKLYTSKEAAEILGVHKRTIDRYRAEGTLVPARKTAGGHSRYTKEQLDKFINPDNESDINIDEMMS